MQVGLTVLLKPCKPTCHPYMGQGDMLGPFPSQLCWVLLELMAPGCTVSLQHIPCSSGVW